jgi:DNA modification methylase
MELTNVLVWHYKNTLGVTPKEKYNLDWQAILYYRGIKAPPINSPLTAEQRAVQEVNAPGGFGGGGFRYHTWQKPDELAERFIRHATAPEDVVYDPFACTGTFLLAASRLGRKGFGAEINEIHAKIAISRGCVGE